MKHRSQFILFLKILQEVSYTMF